MIVWKPYREKYSPENAVLPVWACQFHVPIPAAACASANCSSLGLYGPLHLDSLGHINHRADVAEVFRLRLSAEMRNRLPNAIRRPSCAERYSTRGLDVRFARRIPGTVVSRSSGCTLSIHSRPRFCSRVVPVNSHH